MLSPQITYTCARSPSTHLIIFFFFRSCDEEPDGGSGFVRTNTQIALVDDVDVSESERDSDAGNTGEVLGTKVTCDASQLEEDTVALKKKRKKDREWRFTKALMFTGFIASRTLSLFDLYTDGVLLYKAQADQAILLTVCLFISILAPYVLSYSTSYKAACMWNLQTYRTGQKVDVHFCR